MLRDVRSSLEARAGSVALGLLLLVAGAVTSSAQKGASTPPPQAEQIYARRTRGEWLDVPIRHLCAGRSVGQSQVTAPPEDPSGGATGHEGVQCLQLRRLPYGETAAAAWDRHLSRRPFITARSRRTSTSPSSRVVPKACRRGVRSCPTPSSGTSSPTSRASATRRSARSGAIRSRAGRSPPSSRFRRRCRRRRRPGQYTRKFANGQKP